MPWIVEFIFGILVWLIAVIGLPLLLVVGVFIYIEGAPEITKFLDRTIGKALHFIISNIREVINEIAKIKLTGIIKSIWVYLLSIIIIYLLLQGIFDISYLFSMFGALIESSSSEWSGMVCFWSAGVIVLVIKVSDFSQPFLSMAMFFFPLILTMSTLTLVGMMGSTRGGGGIYRRGSSAGGGSSRGTGSQSEPIVGGLRGLLGGIDGMKQVATIRPLLFMIISFYFGIQNMLSHAFVMLTIAALVEISNEQWFETAAFVSLGMMVLVLQSADLVHTPLLSATMFALPLIVALTIIAPRSATPKTTNSPRKEQMNQDVISDEYGNNDDGRSGYARQASY